MITVQRASAEHIKGISCVCSEGCRDTYEGIKSKESIERNNKRFYNHDRISKELHATKEWDGYIVALDESQVVGAIGGGKISATRSEVFVLYLDPSRRGEGIGTKLLQYLTDIQREKGSTEQWVSVLKGNYKGIPFYEARGFNKDEERACFSNNDEEDYVSIRYVRRL